VAKARAVKGSRKSLHLLETTAQKEDGVEKCRTQSRQLSMMAAAVTYVSRSSRKD